MLASFLARTLLALTAFDTVGIVPALSHDTVPQSIISNVGSPEITNEEPHNYTFWEFKPDIDGKIHVEQSYFEFLMSFRRKENISNEYFQQHWKTIHADLTMQHKDSSVMLMRYTQVVNTVTPIRTLSLTLSKFHMDASARRTIAPLTTLGLKLAKYDGVAEFHARNFESLQDFMNSVFASPVLREDAIKVSKQGHMIAFEVYPV
jgi:hypothetical protein